MTIWEISDYSDLDALRNHEDPVFWDIVEKWLDLQTNEPPAGWLLREVGDTQITELDKES